MPWSLVEDRLAGDVALLDIVLGYDCNLFCDYCTITPEMRRRGLPPQKVAAAIRDARRKGYDAVSFTGGEPTIRPDLVPLIELARGEGFTDIKLQSNGLLLAHGPNVDRLIAAGVTRWNISIHTHEEAAYDALVRREGSYPLMVGALEGLAARGVPLTADVILKRDTVPRLGAAMRWLFARGVRNVHLWFVSLTDGNAQNVESLPKMTEALPAMREAFAFGREHGIEVRSLHVPRCLLGADAPHAYDPGADRVMVVTPEATFELKESKLAGHRYVPVCDGCAHRPVCPGVRPDYLARYGDAELVAARAAH
jgi:cyclic pyranopterin phosphate synthase